VVVFPAPFGPSRPKISPPRTDRSSPSTARVPPGYTLVSASVRITSSVLMSELAATARLLSIRREVFVDAHERVSQDFDLVVIEQRPQLDVGVTRDPLQLGEPPPPGRCDEHEQPPPVVGIRSALD